MLTELIVLCAIATHIFYGGEEVSTSQEESCQGAQGPAELVHHCKTLSYVEQQVSTSQEESYQGARGPAELVNN